MVERTSCRLQAFVWALYTISYFVFTVHWPNVFISLSTMCPSLLKNQQKQRMCIDFLIHDVAFNETVIWGFLTKKKIMLTCLWFCDHFWGSLWITDMWVNVNFKVKQKQVLTSVNNHSRNGKWKRTCPSFPNASMMSGVIYRIVIVIRHWRITCSWSLFNKGFCTIFGFCVILYSCKDFPIE